MISESKLTELFATLVAQGTLAISAWPGEIGSPQDLGLMAQGDEIVLRADLELLSRSEITQKLSERSSGWLRDLAVHLVIGSTNQTLVQRSASRSIDGSVCLAEMQTRGRGRRGRAWFSPFAGNLALSMGIALDREMHDLGGLSLVVGLAAVDCLRTLGVNDLTLKWPNDILLGGRKLGGILIELKNHPGRSAGQIEAIIGIGLNIDVPVSVRQAIDQAITDLVTEGHSISRNLLASRLISTLFDYVKEFERVGFAPMRTVFNDNHLFHQKVCAIALGESVVTGRVAGVTETGEILLETASGTTAFGAGEVSLRWQR
jgi:BirA family biotin operon repressor/biotin-[acetyl-CoA-carboxylase] ligase